MRVTVEEEGDKKIILVVGVFEESVIGKSGHSKKKKRSGNGLQKKN